MKNLFLLLFMTTISAYGQKTGIFNQSIDIGACAHKGYASFDPQTQEYLVSGSGSNMWFDEDQFHYLYTTIQGDFIVRAEVNFLGNGVDPHRKTGWIVKNDLMGNSKHVNASTHGDGLTSLQYRDSYGKETLEILSPDSLPTVIQLERIGSTFIMSTAVFGEEMTQVTLEKMEMDHDVYVGLYVCSHNPDIVETARFRNVRLIRPVDPEFQPYRDYIGSNLEIMDISSGHRQVCYQSSHSIQAPNWSIDGEFLIYNTKGYLHTFHINSNSISPLNTGFATSNNNDHVLSFDGKMIGISHHLANENRASTLYYMPASGSNHPIRVTKPGVGDSYLHGWSPDHQKMVFTGNRKEKYDVYSVDISTGEEQQLTDTQTLDDGPEYSPDGKYVFFNSVRSGKMKLWRMDADGQNQMQLTFDAYNDWFPHVSPDKKWIAFISFPKEIDPNDHPFYKHCLLRIMPYDGGEIKIIGYIYGGQGTMNVPSWSPDSKKIAFVTNTKM